MSKYGVFPGPCFTVSDWIQTRKNFIFRHFLRSVDIQLNVSLGKIYKNTRIRTVFIREYAGGSKLVFWLVLRNVTFNRIPRDSWKLHIPENCILKYIWNVSKQSMIHKCSQKRQNLTDRDFCLILKQFQDKIIDFLNIC